MQHNGINPNQGGLFGWSIEWGGGGFRPLGFDASWVHIWRPNQSKRVSNERWHLFEPMDSLKITLSCIILLQWIDKTAMSDYQNFLVFEAKIFENSHFFTYIGNMYIKWKLESFWIQICYIEHDWFWKKIKNTQNKIFFEREFLVKKKSNMNFSKKKNDDRPIFFLSLS